MKIAKTSGAGLFALVQMAILIVGLSILANPARAQSNQDELVVGWVEVEPIYRLGRDGVLTGFRPELARVIAEELGVSVRFVRYSSPRELFAAQISGETNLLPGTSDTGALGPDQVFSNEVGLTRVHLMVRTELAGQIDFATASGLRIGVIPPTTGSDVAMMREQNDMVPYGNLGDAVLAVFAGTIDAIITVDSVIFSALRSAKLDHFLTIVGPPLLETNQYVAIHSDRAHLLDPINAALARMEADGRLDALRQKFFIEVPEPPADVLVVGVGDFPPYSIVEDNGSFSGYGVDSLRVLAANANLRVDFKPISIEEWTEGPGAGRYDILPELSKDAARTEIMDFTFPTEISEYTIFYRNDGTEFAELEDLQGHRVGVLDVGVSQRIAAEQNLDFVTFSSPKDVVNALMEGEVDAVIYRQRAFAELIEELGYANRVSELHKPFLTRERAIGLRFGLGSIRERLNAQIPAFLASEEYRTLRAKYFEKQVFWTNDRLLLAVIAGLVAGLILLVYSLMNIRGRQVADTLNAQTQALSSRLSAVMNAAESGILGFNRDSWVAVANPKALHILGGLDRSLPFSWPEDIKFVDPEDMAPFDDSQNPVMRALAGQTLKVESAIMTRKKGIDPRYVRISSARLDEETSPDIGTVVIIDDVSEQERSRQQVERSSRLDALGQLTGGIAHDFNNLLATIEYAIQLAQSTDEPETRLGYHTTALNSVRRGANLTNRLLAFAKRQPGLAKSALVDDVLAEFAELARPTIEENIKLEFFADDEDLWIFGDVAQLENALLNLVLNSRDAMIRTGKGDSIVIKARGVAEIESSSALLEEDPHSYIAKGLHQEHAVARARKDGFVYRYVELAVTDNGPGMSEEVMRRAIDPFFTTKDTNSGTGLGLSMVYGFVQQSNGELRIYSEVGHGTTVRLLLPRGTEAGERENPVERMPMPRGNGQVVLIVEDEVALLKMMRDVVSSLGYTIETADNGHDALARIMTGKPVDMLLTDVVMPGGLGGFDLARSARQVNPDLHVIYMSGYTGFSPEEMGDVVAPLIQKPSPPAIIARAIDEAFH